MEHGVIDGATFRVGFAQSQVDGTTDFFVKKHVFCEFCDAVVGADSKFTSIVGTIIGIKQGVEQGFAPFGTGLNNFAVFEGKADVFNFLTAVNTRKGETNGSVYAFFYRRSKDFTAGEIMVAIGINPDPVCGAEGQIGIPWLLHGSLFFDLNK